MLDKLLTSSEELLSKIRTQRPLVQCLTNYVSMDLMANGLLALGASPAMVHAEEEVGDFVQIAQSLLVNIGTLSRAWVSSMLTATEACQEIGKSWVLDPVGCGATLYRTQTALRLLKNSPAILRGNASEILALAGAAMPKGMQTQHAVEDTVPIADYLAKNYKCVVIVTGAEDYLTDGQTRFWIHNGSPLMTYVTAMGCLHGAVLAACLALTQDPLVAAVTGTLIMGVCGDLAAKEAPLPGSFRTAFLDKLAELVPAQLRAEAKIMEMDYVQTQSREESRRVTYGSGLA